MTDTLGRSVVVTGDRDTGSSSRKDVGVTVLCAERTDRDEEDRTLRLTVSGPMYGCGSTS